jgi:hypothetical protein
MPPSVRLSRSTPFLGACLITLLAVTPTLASTITYTSSATFAAALGTSVTDDYSNSGYQLLQTNSVMSAVLGETDYTSTGFTDHNLVVYAYYCAGCNGSFLLTFTSTSVGTSSGVYGAGFNFFNGSSTVPYYAFITFGDGSTMNVALPVSATLTAFFGITSDLAITSMHLGLSGGNSTTDNLGSFGIDNLTIGAAPAAAVPEPASLGLLALGLVGLGARKWRQRKGIAQV